MKIAMISEGNSGGIYRYTLELSDALTKSGLDINNLWINKGSLPELKINPKLLEDYSIIHIQHEYNLFGKGSIFFPRFIDNIKKHSKAKIVFTMHSVRSQKENLGIFGFIKKKVFTLMNRKILSSADKIIVHTENSKKILVEDYNFPAKLIEVIPMWIPPIDQISKKVIFKDKINLLCWGFIQPHKNYESIINMMPSLPREICLEIIGSAHKNNLRRDKLYIEKLNSIIYKLNLQNRVRVIDEYLEDKVLDRYIYGSDVILLPYKYITTSAVFYRSLAFRKPIIASDIPFFREINESTGFPILFNKKNPEKNIIDTIKNKKIKKRIDICMKKFDLNILLKKYISLYYKMIN